MFYDIGKKIQGVVSTVTVIGIVLSCIGGIAVFVIMGCGFGAFLIGIIIAGVLSLFIWLSNLVLFAFGKIAECSEEQVILMERLIEITSKMEPKTSNNVTKKEMEPNTNYTKPAYLKENNTDQISKYCLECGALLRAGQHRCPECQYYNS